MLLELIEKRRREPLHEQRTQLRALQAGNKLRRNYVVRGVQALRIAIGWEINLLDVEDHDHRQQQLGEQLGPDWLAPDRGPPQKLGRHVFGRASRAPARRAS